MKIDKRTGNLVEKLLVIENNSRVLYDEKHIPLEKIKTIIE